MSTEEIKQHLANQFQLPVDQIESMLPSFLEALGAHMEALEKAMSEADLLRIGKAGHTIKGAFLNLGLKECAEIALEVELAGKAGDATVNYREKIDSLHRLLKSVI